MIPSLKTVGLAALLTSLVACGKGSPTGVGTKPAASGGSTGSTSVVTGGSGGTAGSSSGTIVMGGSGGTSSGSSSGGRPGTLFDPRDGKTYDIVTIGDQTWMAANLDYKPSTSGSWCYDDLAANCTTYGRLYDWATAMQIATTYNSASWGGGDAGGAPHQGICPTGWHLPSDAEWRSLEAYAGDYAATRLRSTSGWTSDGGVGTDDYGFCALPGGNRNGLGQYFNAGTVGHWWTSTEDDVESANYRTMRMSIGGVGHTVSYKVLGISVRCLKDAG